MKVNLSKFIKYSAVLLFAVVFTACNYADENAVSVDEFAQLVEANECLLIDVRTADEYMFGHIKTSATVDYYSSEFEHKFKYMDVNKCVALYCKSGSRSAKALTLLKEDLGFTNIVHLKGGISAWKRAGYEVVKD